MSFTGVLIQNIFKKDTVCCLTPILYDQSYAVVSSFDEDARHCSSFVLSSAHALTNTRAVRLHLLLPAWDIYAIKCFA